VSVVIPTRNAAETVGGQLAALAAQTYTGDWELVVADNGSTDDTAPVLHRWADRIPHLRVVDASGRLGSAAARNAGVAASRGELLAFCEADDVVTPEWLAALVATAPEYDMVSGTIEPGTLSSPEARAWRGFPPTPLGLLSFGGFLPFAVGASCGVWRDVLDAVGGWNEEYRSQTDVELSWRVQVAGYTLGLAPDALVHYRLRSSLRALARQSFNEGVAGVHLYRDFRAHGVPRPPPRAALREWRRIATRVPRALRSSRARGKLVHEVAGRVGRLVGSVRCKTLFL
jgi:glycosyltransferase involved in cell wall biosynthesis